MRVAVRAAAHVDEASACALHLSHRAPLVPTAPGPLRCRGLRGHGNSCCLRRVLATAAVVLVSSSRLGSGKVHFEIELRRVEPPWQGPLVRYYCSGGWGHSLAAAIGRVDVQECGGGFQPPL